MEPKGWAVKGSSRWPRPYTHTHTCFILLKRQMWVWPCATLCAQLKTAALVSSSFTAFSLSSLLAPFRRSLLSYSIFKICRVKLCNTEDGRSACRRKDCIIRLSWHLRDRWKSRYIFGLQTSRAHLLHVSSTALLNKAETKNPYQPNETGRVSFAMQKKNIFSRLSFSVILWKLNSNTEDDNSVHYQCVERPLPLLGTVAVLHSNVEN